MALSMGHQEAQNEIQEALGRTYDVPDELDESDLMDELDALGEDLAMESAAGESGSVPSYMQVFFILFSVSSYPSILYCCPFAEGFGGA